MKTIMATRNYAEVWDWSERVARAVTFFAMALIGICAPLLFGPF